MRFLFAGRGRLRPVTQGLVRKGGGKIFRQRLLFIG